MTNSLLWWHYYVVDFFSFFWPQYGGASYLVFIGSHQQAIKSHLETIYSCTVHLYFTSHLTKAFMSLRQNIWGGFTALWLRANMMENKSFWFWWNIPSVFYCLMDNYSFEVISLIFRYLFDIMPVLIGSELKHETVLCGRQEPLFEQPGESPASCFEGGR